MAAAKKAPAAKRAATTKAKAPRTAASRRTRKPTEGRPGPKPLVLRGFTCTATEAGDPTARWAPGSPVAKVLSALNVGATWDLAASYAKLNQATPRAWNARGAEALGEHLDLASLLDAGLEEEAVAYAAFFLSAAEARGAPVLGALEEIDRARKKGDWKAGAHLLRVLPQARDYTEVTRQQLAGPEDEPLAAGVTILAEQAMLDLADRIAAEAAEAGGGS